MLYYVGKILQALGLGILLIGFIQRFPSLVDYKMFGASVLVFVSGWLIAEYLVKK